MIACTSSCLHNRSAFLFCSAFLLGASSQLQATCSPEADTMWNLRSESAPCHWLPVELYSFLSMHIAPTLTFFALPHMVCSFRTLLWTLSYTLQQCNSMICCSKLGSQCAAPVPESQCYLSAGTAWQCQKKIGAISTISIKTLPNGLKIASGCSQPQDLHLKMALFCVVDCWDEQTFLECWGESWKTDLRWPGFARICCSAAAVFNQRILAAVLLTSISDCCSLKMLYWMIQSCYLTLAEVPLFARKWGLGGGDGAGG